MIESEEAAVGAPTHSCVVRSPGDPWTCRAALKWGGGHGLGGLSSPPGGSALPQVDSVGIELNCRTLGCVRDLLGVEAPHIQCT